MIQGQTPEQTRFQGHPSRLTLEEVAFSEPPHAWASHVEGCESCRTLVTTLRSKRSAFLATHPPAYALARVREHSSWRAWLGWPRALAPALLVAVTLLVVGTFQRSEIVRAKGSPGLRFALLRSRQGEPATPVSADALFRPGDVLRFRVQAPEDGHLLLMNVDTAGVVTRYFPASPGTSGRVRAGDQVLPGAIELDESPLNEQLVLVFSRSPLNEELVRRVLRQRASLEGSAPDELRDAQVITTDIHRQAP